MSKEEIINDINKIIQEIIDIIDERDLAYLRNELEKMYIAIKYTVELKETLRGENHD